MFAPDARSPGRPRGSDAALGEGHVALRRGRDLAFGTAPRGAVVEDCAVALVALLAADFPGATLDPVVAEGESVRQGQVLCVDRHRPSVAFVASAAGRVAAIRRGARRRFEALVITQDADQNGDQAVSFDTDTARDDDDALRALLLRSGAWTGLRTRPFGQIPDPAARPAAIFVTATDTNPLAADTAAIMAPLRAAFQPGLDALARLTAGPVFLCQGEGAALAEAGARLRLVRFSGPHPAGLAGTQIHHLLPVGRRRAVWQIGAQEVAALGHLLLTGRVMVSRVLSVAGDGVSAPALVRAPLGAALADLARGVLTGAGSRLIAGSALAGREAAHLGRHDLQVTVLASPMSRFGKGDWRHRLADRLAGGRAGAGGAMLPLEALDAAFPFDIPATPLMRALAIGDIETAEKLGCLELLEEDMALLSRICPSGQDYGALLRATLDRLAEEHRA